MALKAGQSRNNGLFLKLTVLLVSVLTVMSAGTIAPVLPLLATVFESVPNAELLSKLMLSIPALFLALSAPLAGKIIDRYGRLKLLYFGLVLYAISGTSAFFLSNIYFILIGRIFLGVSIGITMTIAVTLAGDYFVGEARRKFVGLQGAFIASGGVVFVAVGGFLADINWRMPFLIYGLSLLIIPLAMIFLIEPQKRPVDERSEPVKTSRLLYVIYASAIVFMILFYIIPTQLPFRVQEIGINKSALAGIALAMNSMGGVVASLFYSRVKKKLEYAQVSSLGFMLMAIGYIISGLTSNFSIMLAALFAAGTGFGLILPNLNLWVIQLTKVEVRGKKIGMLTTGLFLGQFLSPLIVAPFNQFMDLSRVFVYAGVCLFLMSIFFIVLNQFVDRKIKASNTQIP